MSRYDRNPVRKAQLTQCANIPFTFTEANDVPIWQKTWKGGTTNKCTNIPILSMAFWILLEQKLETFQSLKMHKYQKASPFREGPNGPHTQQTWSGFSPTTVPDNKRQSGFSPTTVPKLSAGYCLSHSYLTWQALWPYDYTRHTELAEMLKVHIKKCLLWKVPNITAKRSFKKFNIAIKRKLVTPPSRPF